MKQRVLLAFFVLWLASCGKVGDPRPPVIRIPATIGDLKAVQNQDEITLTWTNPSKYVDGSLATDLTTVRVFRNGERINTLPLSGIGKSQSTILNISTAIGATQIYTLAVETKRGKISAISNDASIVVVAVPGVVLNPTFVMDQGRIRLDWQPPDRNPSFADVYIVRRVDGTVPPKTVKETHFEDPEVETGKTYTYIVTAARGDNPPVPGPPGVPIVAIAIDKKAPATPTGLQPPVVSDAGAILRWDINTESDLAGYRVYRSDNPNSGFTRLDEVIYTIPSIQDGNYKPGLNYEVTAVDVSGNESLRSQSVRAP